jgi:hypothetical protein
MATKTFVTTAFPSATTMATAAIAFQYVEASPRIFRSALFARRVVVDSQGVPRLEG